MLWNHSNLNNFFALPAKIIRRCSSSRPGGIYMAKMAPAYGHGLPLSQAREARPEVALTKTATDVSSAAPP